MTFDILEDPNYKNIIEGQTHDIIEYLQDNNLEFTIVANLKGVDFEPELPTKIIKKYDKFMMFSLANYTYTTLDIRTNDIVFEAGFGKENFGSVVTIPFCAIHQLILNDSVLYLNPTATIDKYFLNTNDTLTQEQRSKNAFIHH